MRHLKNDVWPYQCEIPVGFYRDEYPNMERYCNEMVGTIHHDWYVMSYNSCKSWMFAFKNVEDAIMFKLRWK